MTLKKIRLRFQWKDRGCMFAVGQHNGCIIQLTTSVLPTVRFLIRNQRTQIAFRQLR